jgi:hypothetical protein
MYDVLYPLPVRTFWGRQEGVYTSCTDSTGSAIKPMGYAAPEAFLIFCGACAEFGRHYFTPCVFDSDLNALSGFAKCDRCQKEYKVWLMELKGNSTDGNWTEAWITPKPDDDSIREKTQFIPKEFSEVARNYKEAKDLLEFSPRASAAICRVALESIIADKLKVRERDLYTDINKIYKENLIPGFYIDEDDLHAIRNISAISVHFFKNKKTKAVIDITYDEARLCLSILEDLIEILFVSPAIRKQKKDNFKKKVSDGKE